MLRAALGAAALVCALAAPRVASAEPTAQDKVAAEALFREARALLAKDIPQACAKFEASQRLDPTAGTLLNLADCLERNGQRASAWERFLEAARAAREAKQAKREQLARARAAALEPTLPRVLIVPKGSAKIEVRRNGSVVDPATFGTAVPTDPGAFTIEVKADGRKPWSTRVVVQAAASTTTVTIPAPEELEPEPSAAQARTSDPSPVTAPPRRARGLPTAVWIAGGVAVASAGVGTVLGLGARSKWGEATEGCRGGCTEAAVETGREARAFANGSTIAFAVSGAALVASVIFLLADKDPSPRARALFPALAVGPNGASLGVSGAIF